MNGVDNAEYHGWSLAAYAVPQTWSHSYPKMFWWVLAKHLQADSKSEIQSKNTDGVQAQLKGFQTSDQLGGPCLDDTSTEKGQHAFTKEPAPPADFHMPCFTGETRTAVGGNYESCLF